MKISEEQNCFVTDVTNYSTEVVGGMDVMKNHRCNHTCSFVMIAKRVIDGTETSYRFILRFGRVD